MYDLNDVAELNRNPELFDLKPVTVSSSNGQSKELRGLLKVSDNKPIITSLDTSKS